MSPIIQIFEVEICIINFCKISKKSLKKFQIPAVITLMDNIKVDGVNRFQAPAFEPAKANSEDAFFDIKNSNPIDSTTLETEDKLSPEAQICLEMFTVFSDPNLATDENLLLILDDLKNYDLATVMKTFSFNNNGVGLMDVIEECDTIKDSTKDKFYNFLNNKLSKVYGFDKHFKNKNQQTVTSFGDYTYYSDIYNIVQKGEETLEITNKTNGEKRVIDFSELIPSETNSLHESLELKAAFQKLPGEILFQIPEETSLIINIRRMQAIEFSAMQMEEAAETAEADAVADAESAEDAEVPEFDSVDETEEMEEMEEPQENATYMDKEGMLSFLGDGYEILYLSPDPESIIHEVAHTVFNNSSRIETLNNNPLVVQAFEEAVENLKKDGGEQFVYDGDFTDELENGEVPKNYWSRNISEFGAEIVTAVFSKDYKELENIKKYVPEYGIKAVMEVFNERFYAEDKHEFHDLDEIRAYLDLQENNEERTD